MRFDGKKYRDCRWCHGGGCLYCESEYDKAYKREFPNGPEPILEIKYDEVTPQTMSTLIDLARALKRNT